MTDLLRTPLAETHQALGARMVAFGGWLMPLQYTSILAEHTHTRSAAGLFDLSHMGRLAVRGPDAERLLQYATTNDIARLEPGQAQYSLFCNEQGGVIDDLLVYRLEEDWRLVVNAANRLRDVAHLDALRAALGCRCQIEDETRETALLGIQGPEAELALAPLVHGDLASLGYYRAVRLDLALGPTAAIVSRTGYTGEDGFELWFSAQHAVAVWGRLLENPRVRPVGLGARDTLRLEAGMALYGHELTEGVTPYEAGLGRVVKPEKGPFVGREALAQLRDQPLTRRLTGLSLEPGPVPRQGNAVWADGQLSGEIASGGFSPTLRRPIATAFLHPDHRDRGRELRVAIRDTQVPARVVSLPFVPHRTKSGRK